jgi:cell division protein FtsW (lipid II flippase)
MRPALRETDKPLVAVTLVLAAVGLATLYSAGQTDVPSFVSTIWHRQLVWLGLGLVAALLMYRTSPRLLEWATPYAYGIALVVLMFTLLVGTGGDAGALARGAA